DGAAVALRRWVFERPGTEGERILSDLRSALAGDMLFDWPFRRVRWAWVNTQATLIPRRLFRPEHLPTYFHLLLPSGQYAYGYDELPELECYVAYALDPAWVNLVEQQFKQVQQTHFAHPLLRSWRHMAQPDGYEVFLHVHQRTAQVAVFDRQSLLFFNAFTFTHANDLLYFTLLAYEQARLSPDEVALSISGKILEDSEGWRALYRYIRQLRFVALSADDVPADQHPSLPLHCHWDVFCWGPAPRKPSLQKGHDEL
ncbi:MAG TPA: DUF3822 family protein, partial [Saprospiraceae bacterium]|nr:DUF3822 family protein [Saprospiraceae bacterium]